MGHEVELLIFQERRVMQIVFSPASDNVVDDVKITELVYRL
ncbi:MAG TPA: hypothetical protein VKP88_03875 [Candidatus Paceibacterota bacterium]|nr:hypothetical protein [Candidatus Paceibacterota bacterium]